MSDAIPETTPPADGGPDDPERVPAPPDWTGPTPVAAVTAPPPPPPASPEPAAVSPSPASTFLRDTFVPELWKRSLLTAAAAVGAAVVLALVTALMLVAAVGIVTSSLGTNPLTDGSTAPGIWPLWIGIAGLAMLGEITINGSVPSSNPSAYLGSLDSTTTGASIVLTPLLLTLLIAAVVMWIAWRLAPRPVSPWTTRLITSAVAGLAAAIAMEVVALVGTWQISVLTIDVSATSAGVRLFFGAFFITALSSFAGGSLAAADTAGVGLGGFVEAIRRATRSMAPAWRSVVLSVAVAAATGAGATLVGVLIAGTLNGQIGFTLLTLPLWLGTSTVWLLTLGEFGAIVGQAGATTSTSTTGANSSFTYSVFNAQTPWLWLSVLVAVISMVVTAMVLRSAARTTGRLAPMWVLPTAAAVGWLVLPWIGAEASLSAIGSLSSVGATVAGSVGEAPWFFLIAAVWALATDALARYVLPAWGGNSFGTLERGRIRLISALVVLGIAVVIVGVVGVGLLNALLFSPSAAAQGYLDDIAAGKLTAARTDVEGSVQVSGGPRNEEDRIQNAHVVSATTTGDNSTIAVAFTVGGRQYVQDLDAEKTGTTALIFQSWKITTPLTEALILNESISPDIRLDGEQLPSEPVGSTLRLSLYPGVYHLALPTEISKYVALSRSAVVLSEDGASVGESPTSALVTAVQQGVNQQVAHCALADVLDPTGCPFSVDWYDQVQNVTWTVDTYPTVELGDGGTSFDTTNCGSATASFLDVDSFSGTTSSQSDGDTCFDVAGSVAVGENGVTVAITG